MSKANMQRRAKVRERISEYKAETRCRDCRQFFHPVCMDFDHVGGVHKKHLTIAQLVANEAPWDRIIEEMLKCDLVCANCHRMRTYFRRYHL